MDDDNHNNVSPPKPQVFSGDVKKVEPRTWLQRIEWFFEHKGLQPGNDDFINWVKEVRLWFSDKAITWWMAHAQAIQSWHQFRLLFLAHYAPLNPADTPRDRLDRCRQFAGVTRYNHEFNSICNEIEDLSASERLQRYKSGLKEKVRNNAMLMRPTTFIEWEQCALIADAQLYHSHVYNRDHRSVNNYSRNYDFHAGPIPMELGAFDHHSSRRPKNGQQRSSLPPQLRAQLIQEGKCFHCHKTGHVVLNCPERKARKPGHQQRGQSW